LPIQPVDFSSTIPFLTAIQQLQHQLGDLDEAQISATAASSLLDPLTRVVVFGEFSVGKSTLINALLGRRMLPSKLMPTTGQATHLRWHENEQVELYLKNGQVERHGLASLAHLGVLDPSGSERQEIERIEVMAPLPLLKAGLRLIDTPGVAEADQRTQRARRELEGADLVLLIVRANHPLGLTERRFAQEIAGELGKPLLLVVNFTTLVEPHDRDDLRRLFRRWADGLPPVSNLQVLEIDAMAALRWSLGLATDAPVDDFSRLCALLKAWPEETEVRWGTRVRLVDYVTIRGQCRNDVRTAELTADFQRAQTMRRDELERAEAAHRRIVDEDIALGAVGMCQSEVGSTFAAGWETLKSAILQLSGTSSSLASEVRQEFDRQAPATVSIAERACSERLAQLVGHDRTRLAPLTITEQVSLGTRTEVEIETSEGAPITIAVIGGVLGQVFIPIPGIGAAIGAAFGAWLGTPSPPTAETVLTAHLTAVEKDWQMLEKLTLKLTERQVTDRLEALAFALQQQITALANLAPSDEAVVRHNLKGGLDTLRQQANALAPLPFRSRTVS
jgi:hypothetical protein